MTLSHQRVLLSASALIWCSSCDRVVVGPNGDSQLLAPLTLPVMQGCVASVREAIVAAGDDPALLEDEEKFIDLQRRKKGHEGK